MKKDMPLLSDPNVTQSERDLCNVVVMYHANCMDGWLCALIARVYLGEKPVLFEPRAYEQGFDPNALAHYAGKHVYILDFSFPVPQLELLAKTAKTVTVLDHHKTFAESCEKDPNNAFIVQSNPTTPEIPLNLQVHYNPLCCGAEITYSFFGDQSSSQVRPTIDHEIVQYISDRDLWKWERPNSHKMYEYLMSLPKDYQTWLRLFRTYQANKDNFIKIGETLLTVKSQEVEHLARTYFVADIAGFKDIPMVNTQMHQSEVGHRMLELCPSAPFVALYFDVSAGVRKWSLRGRKSDDFDCTTVAKQFNGGGHVKACGFKTAPSNDPLMQMYIKNSKA